MKKICIVGSPSTGKTTLAKSLVKKLNQKNYQTRLVSEYARSFIIQYGPPKDIKDQLNIVIGQIEIEKRVERKNPDFIICDSASYLTYVYSKLYKPKSTDYLANKRYFLIQKRITEIVEPEISSYNLHFFLPIEFDFKDDGVRIFKQLTYKISKEVKQLLEQKKINYYLITGTVEERTQKALDIILSQYK